MFNKFYSGLWGKNITLLFIMLLLTEIIFSIEYIVPQKTASVDVADIDLDGDLDIVIGHDPTGEQGWGGLSILENNSYCSFNLIDSLLIMGYQPDLQASFIDNNEFPDFVALSYDYENSTSCFEIIYNYGYEQFNDINFFSYNESITIREYNVCKLGNDDSTDIVFISHMSECLGILHNNGYGEYTDPEYYDLGPDYYPSGLDCGDLNNDGRDDILVSGSGNLDIWYNHSNNLQYSNISETAYIGNIQIADIDNDGDNDIIGCESGMPGGNKQLVVYTNDGNGNFDRSYTKWIYEAMAEINLSDLNNDNYPDIIYNVSIYYSSSEAEIFHTFILFNNQDGTFLDPVNYYTGICSHKSYSVDLDGNGWNDIITLNYDFYNPPPEIGSIHILFNDGTGNFVEEPQVGIISDELVSNNYHLSNYPNPFNPSTTISFSIPEDSNVELSIFNIKGQKVKSLARESFDVGNHSIIWNGNDDSANSVSSGIYFYKLNVNGESEQISKCILMK